MRRPKISLKTYFYFTLICALILIFGFNLRERELRTWKPKNLILQNSQNFNQQQQTQNALDATDDDYFVSDGEEDVHDSNNNSNKNKNLKPDVVNAKNIVKKSPTKEEELPLQQQLKQLKQQLQQQELRQQYLLEQQQLQQQELPSEKDLNEKLQQQKTQQQQQQQLQASITNNNYTNNSNNIEKVSAKLWFFKNGEYYPKPAQIPIKQLGKKQHLQGSKLFPFQDPQSDRILNQLMYVPPNYEQIRESGKLKTILLYNGLGPWNVKQGRQVFLNSKCPVDTCEITANRDRASTADMILYKDHFIPTGLRRPNNSKQVTMLYYLECPYHTQNVKVPDAVNWTATYRRDSDIVAPYEKWQYYDTNIRQAEQDRNYVVNKTKKVAWFVSNCGARNGRLQYAHELQKFIDVDIYGACGNYKCARSTADKCFDILDRDYKFYLAFENSNCKDYITEKFFVNALNRNVLPIVMGARPEDYEVSAPHRSYIHVDEFSSPKELADYLNILDKNDELYNSYFKWKGTGEFINTYYWCRVCAALHDEESLRKPRWYPDVNNWWRGPGVCTNGSWRNFQARKDVITDD